MVSNGIGITPQAEVELPGIKGMWSLRNAAAGAAAADGARFLVLSFISETRVLAMQVPRNSARNIRRAIRRNSARNY